MKFFLSEIFRIYKKDPLKISIIWLMDLFQSLIIAANPYIIGKCIDDLLQQKYVWLIILINLEILWGISQAANKWLDTRVYSRIVEEEHTSYYSRVAKTEEDSSLISARLDLVDDIPNFLEANVLQIFNMILGVTASLFFLYTESKAYVFWLAIVISILIPVITYPFQAQIACNNTNYKNLDENRITSINSRDLKTYKNFVHQILYVGIQNSDLDTKIFIFTHLLQTILLFTSILSIINTEKFTSGLLLSTITYIEMLNGYSSSINDNIILIKDSVETSKRLNIKERI